MLLQLRLDVNKKQVLVRASLSHNRQVVGRGSGASLGDRARAGGTGMNLLRQCAASRLSRITLNSRDDRGQGRR